MYRLCSWCALLTFVFCEAWQRKSAPAKQPANFTAHFCIGRFAAGPSRVAAGSVPLGTPETHRTAAAVAAGTVAFAKPSADEVTRKR